MAVGALALFLARDPLKRAVGRLFSGSGEESDEDLVTTRIEIPDDKFNMSAPIVEASVKEGVV
jgi:hypothetical protein